MPAKNPKQNACQHCTEAALGSGYSRAQPQVAHAQPQLSCCGMTARTAELWRAACECCLQSADARLRWAPDFARWSQVPPNCKLHRVPVGGSSARLNTPAFLRERLLLLPRAASRTAPLRGGARTNKPEGARSEQWDECCSPQPCLPHAAYSSGSGEPWPPPQPQGGVQHSTRQAHPVRVQAAPGNRCKIKPQRRELPRLELARKGASPFYSETRVGSPLLAGPQG